MKKKIWSIVLLCLILTAFLLVVDIGISDSEKLSVYYSIVELNANTACNVLILVKNGVCVCKHKSLLRYNKSRCSAGICNDLDYAVTIIGIYILGACLV